ncbi:MAG: chorismate-binding protein [Bacteroidota bacterium]
MKEYLQTLNIPAQKELVSHLISAGYAFAAWKMPDVPEIQMIVSLNPPKKIVKPALEELFSGFVINSYESNHPTGPYYIKADLVFKGNVLTINPTVSDGEVDQFAKVLGGSELPAKNDLQEKEAKRSKNDFSAGLAEAYIHKVAEAKRQIEKGILEKVVLSRYSEEALPKGFSIWEYFQKLCTQYPDAFCSLSSIPGRGVWIGASPELLISDREGVFKTVSLAGTKKLKEGEALNNISWTQKEIEEQAFVSRYIINCFKKLRLREFHEHGPKTVRAGKLAHLKTTFEVRYKEEAFEGLSSQMATLLHPTSAVCGMPISEAKPWIQADEGYQREFYSGFLGPVNYEQSTDLFVNLRCAKILGDRIRFYAGAGITEDSIPEKEYEETEMKMDVLRQLVPSDR